MDNPLRMATLHNNNTFHNVFTVDLEEWFQGLTSTNPRVDLWPALESRVVAATQQLLALLRRNQVRATFFVLGYVADQYPALIEAIRSDGHELGVHGYYHRFVTKLTPDEFSVELARSIEAVIRITGEAPLGHRAPYFSINATTPWAFGCMEAQGLRYDSSVFPTRNLLYGFPGAPRLPYRAPGRRLWELPASTVQWLGGTWPVAGGFYMRALPYPVIRAALRRLQRAGEPAILYVHPWELDLGQHYRQITPRERVTHYFGRRGLAAKLERLLSDFQFTTAGELVRQLELDAASAPSVQASPAESNPGPGAQKQRLTV
jgi:polysaccharide deacetylase family protein (PEP-CTERM system associated)